MQRCKIPGMTADITLRDGLVILSILTMLLADITMDGKTTLPIKYHEVSTCSNDGENLVLTIVIRW